MPKSARQLVSKYKPFLFPIASAVVIVISISNILIHSMVHDEKKVLAAHDVNPVEQEIDFWKDLVLNHPTYRDGYIELAKLYMELDLKKAARENVEIAIGIDPHSEEAKGLADKLGL